MSYGRYPYGGVAYAGSDVADIPQADTQTALAVEWSPTTGPLDEPVWVDITGDVRNWQTSRGRNRELERFQPGRATIVLSNLSRQYDSTHTANIKPMKRIRIRETFNGVTYPVFDGFVDKWKLDYPGVGKDATATVTATDMFKVLARTDLGRSVYAREVAADNPVLWWHLDETGSDPATAALNSGSLGTTGNGTYQGPVKAKGGQTLVNLDPGTSIQVQDPGGLVNVPDMGVSIADTSFDISDTGSWAIEFWFVPAGQPIGVDRYVQGENAAGDGRLLVQSNGAGQDWQFRLVDSGDLVEYGVTGDAAGFVANTRYHVVAKFGPNKAMAIYVNGTKYTTTATGTTAPPLVGVIHPDMDLGFLYTFGDGQTPEAEADEFAVYTSALGVDPLSDARVTAHYNAGNSPWQGDFPGARIGRALDIALVPSTARELDAGITTLQSAEIVSQTVLEHSQKIGETEFGLLFVTRDGKVRLIGRTALFAREPGTAVYGDGAGEVGYRDFVPDDGDEVIRNIARISRLNGVLQTATDQTSVDDFGPFTYTLDGLLHQSDSYSLDYAEFIVAEYGLQKRRITSLTIGPPIVGEEDVVYPAMLGPELGDAITVTNTPTGGGSPFEQVCAIEGIQASGSPGGVRTTRFILSPEFAVAIF